MFIKNYFLIKKLLKIKKQPKIKTKINNIYILKKKTKINYKNFIYFKKKKAFWPIKYDIAKLIKKKYYLTKLSKNLFKKNNNTYLFYKNLKKKTSVTQRIHRFDKSLIKIFWKSRNIYKNHQDIKRQWTARKFYYKYSNFLKKNKDNSKTKTYKIWEIFVTLGIVFTKKETNNLFKYNLLFFNKQTNNETIISNTKNLIVNISYTLYNLLEINKKIHFFYKKKFGRYQRTQYLNRLSQWKDISKKKPKYFEKLIFKKKKTDINFYFDPASISLFINFKKDYFLKNYDSLNFKPRHNLEKLNLFKLKL